MGTILEIKNLKKYFNVGKRKRQALYLHAVDAVSIDVQEGETFGLVGESGSGKSTLAYTIVGMYGATGGILKFKNQDISMKSADRPLALKKQIQIVFQDPGSSLNAKRTIRQILSLPLSLHRGLRGKALEDAAVQLLDKVEFSIEYLDK